VFAITSEVESLPYTRRSSEARDNLPCPAEDMPIVLRLLKSVSKVVVANGSPAAFWLIFAVISPALHGIIALFFVGAQGIASELR
jgi:hypothetical protein